MKSKPNEVVVLIILLFIRCTGSSNYVTGSDSLSILKNVLASKELAKNIVPKNIDIIYFIKSKYINHSWPTQVNRFKIFYIEDSEKTRSPNKSGLKFGDSRLRIGVPVFTVSADTAQILLYNFNFHSEIIFNLKKTNKQWVIVKTHTLLE
jgi:hypothetical protein